jgi:hypothetical protein
MARSKQITRCGKSLRVTIQDAHGRIERILPFTEFQIIRDRQEYQRVSATTFRRRPPTFVPNEKAPDSDCELNMADMLRLVKMITCSKIQRERLDGHLQYPRLRA